MNRSLHTQLAAVLVALLPASAAAGIATTVPRVELRDAFAGRQLLVAENGRDATRAAKYASANTAVARVDATGYVTPAGDGATTIRVELGAAHLVIPVTVSGF